MALPTQQLRLNRNQIAAIVGDDPDAVRQFEALFANINTAISELRVQVDEIAAAQAAAAAANTAAAAANAAAVAADAAAVAAQDTADQVLAESTLANSFTTGLTITATDAGANVTIAMSAHSRVYGDGTTVAVNAGNVTGLAYSTSYWVFYDQASRLGGAVTYQASTSIQGNGTAPDRHFIGAVLTPAAAAPPTGGNPVRPPGFAEP